MKHLDLDPFLTIFEGKNAIDFVADKENVVRVYANGALVFAGRLRDLIYRIHITSANHCELNLRKVLALNIDGNALYGRIHKALQQQKGI